MAEPKAPPTVEVRDGPGWPAAAAVILTAIVWGLLLAILLEIYLG